LEKPTYLKEIGAAEHNNAYPNDALLFNITLTKGITPGKSNLATRRNFNVGCVSPTQLIDNED
jgi:hypothetical protein